MAQDYDPQSFELIIVDLLYDKRREQLRELVERLQPAFPILHARDRSTPFRDEGLLRIASPKNTGAMLARTTDAIVFTDDCQVIPPRALSYLAEWASKGLGATMCYEKRIWGHGKREDRVTGKDARGHHLGIAEGQAKQVPPREIGFLGGTCSMLPVRALVEVNGWDEMFDGSRQLEDADMILRLAAIGQNMAYDNRLTIVEYEAGGYDPDVVSTQAIKCNGAYAQFVWGLGRKQANRGEHLDEVIQRMAWKDCLRIKEGQKCYPHMSPCTKMGEPEDLNRIFRDPRLVFDLADMRSREDWIDWLAPGEDLVWMGEKADEQVW
jgi:hypothetical protein